MIKRKDAFSVSVAPKSLSYLSTNSKLIFTHACSFKLKESILFVSSTRLASEIG